MKNILWGFLLMFLFGVFPANAEQGGMGTASADVVDAGNTVCPVGGRAVNPKLTSVYQGKSYSFCCKGCIEKFNKDPEKYLGKINP